MKQCMVRDCTNKHLTNGKCRRHYDMFRKHGTADYTRKPSLIKGNEAEYAAWQAMRRRCYSPKDASYKYCGGREIKVCERWESFESFLSDMGKRPIGLCLGRIDVNGNYEPANCRWMILAVTIRNRGVNRLNKSGHKGISWDKQKGKWRADIKADYKQKLIGRYETLEEAVSVRSMAEQMFWTS